MAEPGDYAPAPWAQQTSFKQARAQFDKDAGRGYAAAQAAGVTASALVPKSISTKSTHPILFRVDGTGSMGGWPNTMFEKLGYMDHELRTEYLSEDMEVSFGLFCDTGDQYPLQVQPFAKGADLPASLKKLILASGGTGPGELCEAHGIAALYDLHNVKTPEAVIKPPYIIITDEMPYGQIGKGEAEEYAKVALERGTTAAAIFRELQEKYAVYLILKPYGNENLERDEMGDSTARVYGHWKGILGADRIALLSKPERVVDVIYGLLAIETGRVDYFKKEIEARQKPGQVTTVYKALETVHKLPAPSKSVKRLPPGSSVLRSRKSRGR